MKMVAASSLMSFGLTILCVTGALARPERIIAPTDAQKKSLHGLASVKYIMKVDESSPFGDIAKKSFAGANLPLTELSKDEDGKALKPDEGRLIFIVDDSAPDLSFIYIVVDQQCRLSRSDASVWDGKTYEAGKFVPREKEKDTVKEVCDEFVAALNNENPKK